MKLSEIRKQSKSTHSNVAAGHKKWNVLYFFYFIVFIFYETYFFKSNSVQTLQAKKIVYILQFAAPVVGDRLWKLTWKWLKDAADNEDNEEVSHYMLSGKCTLADTRMDFAVVVSDTWICVSLGEQKICCYFITKFKCQQILFNQNKI